MTVVMNGGSDVEVGTRMEGASSEAVVCGGVFWDIWGKHSRPLGPPWCGPTPGLFEER